MTDETLTIRHVCSCGKPANHGSVCRRHRDDTDVERIDRKAEERMAREAEEQDRGRRARLARQRQERRRHLSGLELVVEVIDAMRTISTVKASSVGKSPGGGDDSSHGPARQHRIEDDPRWRLSEAQLHRHGMALAELVDEARGLGVASSVSALSAEEKNATIRDEGVGLTAEELFFRLGPGYGSPSFIRKWRRDNGYDNRGNKKEGQS